MTSVQDNPGFWYVEYRDDRSKSVLQPDRESRNLRNELDGTAVGETWSPPRYEIMGSGSWPDWMSFWVPLLSTKALDILTEFLEPHSQLLPWIDEPGHKYTLVNITTRIAREHWSCKTSSVYGTVYVAADGIQLHDTEIPHIFRLQGYDGKIFVSDTLARTSVEHGLKDAVFVDPSIDVLDLPHIRVRFGRKGTGFIRRQNGLPDSGIR
jgi:hypothetical protein